jgi:hypothetical protein
MIKPDSGSVVAQGLLPMLLDPLFRNEKYARASYGISHNVALDEGTPYLKALQHVAVRVPRHLANYPGQKEAPNRLGWVITRVSILKLSDYAG